MIALEESRYNGRTRPAAAISILMAAIILAAGGCARSESITEEQRARGVEPPRGTAKIEEDFESIEAQENEASPPDSSDEDAEIKFDR